MSSRQPSAFFLPFVLLLCSGLLAAGMVWIQFAADSVRRQTLHTEAGHMDQLLRAQIPAVQAFLQTALQENVRATREQTNRQTGARTVLLAPANGERPTALHSHRPGPAPAYLRMASPYGTPLHTEALPLEETASTNSVLYFAAEDITLAAPEAIPDDWYPFPHYDLLPVEESGPPIDPAALLNAPATDSVPPAPESGPVPFLPQNEPPVTPVILSASLRFSIFAAGPLHHTEKPIRIRYHLQLHLWNPYDRPMRLHSGSGRQPFARLLVHDMPAVRIENVTTGHRTDWRSPDLAANSASGRQGLSAWLEAPPHLGPGASLRLTGPDPNNQPEGLARTLHPAFRIGPAHTVRLRFQNPNKAPSFTLLPFAAEHPPEAAARGEGWFRARNLSPPALPEVSFRRADQGTSPFFLHGGSLAYRQDQSQFLLRLTASPAIRSAHTDPRKAVVHGNQAWQRPDASTGSTNEWYTVHWIDLRHAPAPTAQPAPQGDLFSYPQSNRPPPWLHLSLPGNPDSFLCGTPNALRWNHFLNRPLFLARLRTPSAVSAFPLTVSGQSLPAVRVFPVNQNKASAWESFLQLPPPQNSTVAAAIAARLLRDPVASPAAFFNRGDLPAAVPRPGPAGNDPRHPFRPLQNWLTRGPVLAGHGPAWLLHLAVFRHTGTRQLRRSARLWLHKIPQPEDNTPRLRLIRFQWTDPSQHLLPAPRLPGT